MRKKLLYSFGFSILLIYLLITNRVLEKNILPYFQFGYVTDKYNAYKNDHYYGDLIAENANKLNVLIYTYYGIHQRLPENILELKNEASKNQSWINLINPYSRKSDLEAISTMSLQITETCSMLLKQFEGQVVWIKYFEGKKEVGYGVTGFRVNGIIIKAKGNSLIYGESELLR